MNNTLEATRLQALRTMAYADYLRTPEWRRRRDRALMRACWCCEWPDCRDTDRLEVHHRSYEFLGAERDEDLRVLCPRHHHGLHDRFETLRRLHWRVIRDVINSGPFESFADFVDTVKYRFHAHRILVDGYDLNELLSVTLRAVVIEIPGRAAPDAPRDHDAPPIGEAEARAILADLNISLDSWRVMPRVRTTVTQDPDDYAAARERAWEMGIELSRDEFLR
jgi:hypothetical protein